MRSSKCPKCALVQWAEINICKRCGSQLGDGVSQQPAERDAQPQSHYSSFAAPAHLKSGLAIASMVLAIISVPTTLLLLGIILAPTAIVMGIVALTRANKNPMTYGGKGFAIAGISVGSVVCVFFIPLIAAIAIPNILAARKAANEGGALHTLENIATAQNAYLDSQASDSACGDLATLASKKLIEAELAGGRKFGYRFTAGGKSEYECEVRATPESRSQGNRSFYFSNSDGVVRVAMDGAPADPTDPPLEDNSRASR